MLAFILRRLIQAMIVMVTVAFIAFMLFQYVDALRGTQKAINLPVSPHQSLELTATSIDFD